MRLKFIVVSMGFLGLIHQAAIAADEDTAQYTKQISKVTTTKTTTTTSKPTMHNTKPVMHKKTHHGMQHGKTLYHEEGGGFGPGEAPEMGPAAIPAAAPLACGLSNEAIVMDNMTQNVNRALPNPCNPGWFDRIFASGGINVDMGKWGKRDANFMGENYKRVSLNDAYINIFATVNNYTHAFLSFSYNTATAFDSILAPTFNEHISEYSAAYSDNVIENGRAVQLEQGFITFADFPYSPFFIQLGKQFQDFSRYEIHPITRTMTQVLSETLATSAKAGFIANGFNGSIYAFDDPIRKGDHHRKTNYGAALGYERPCECLGWDVGIAYLYNMIGVNDVAYNVAQFNLLTSENHRIGYHDKVSAVAFYFDMNSGPFTLNLRYTTALQRFDSLDLPRHNTIFARIGEREEDGAKPWAAGIELNYGFYGWCGMPQNVYLGYQTSRQTETLNLPKYRYVLGYGAEVYHNTTVTLEWDHDVAHHRQRGDFRHPGGTSNLVSIRTSVQFG